MVFSLFGQMVGCPGIVVIRLLNYPMPTCCDSVTLGPHDWRGPVSVIGVTVFT